MVPKRTIFQVKVEASSIITIELVMAPGPQIIGMASGVIEMSFMGRFNDFLENEILSQL